MRKQTRCGESERLSITRVIIKPLCDLFWPTTANEHLVRKWRGHVWWIIRRGTKAKNVFSLQWSTPNLLSKSMWAQTGCICVTNLRRRIDRDVSINGFRNLEEECDWTPDEGINEEGRTMWTMMGVLNMRIMQEKVTMIMTVLMIIHLISIRMTIILEDTADHSTLER